MPCTECRSEDRDVCQGCFDVVLEHLQWALRQLHAKREYALCYEDLPKLKGAAIAAHLDPETMEEGPHCVDCGRFILPEEESSPASEGGVLCSVCGPEKEP